MLALIFLESETVFEISVSDKEIENSITEDSINIVIDAALLVLAIKRDTIGLLNTTIVFVCNSSS